MKADKIFLR